MKKSLYLFIFCFFLLGYNCIGWGFGLSDITDAAKSTVNKAKDSVTSSTNNVQATSSKSDGVKDAPAPSRKKEDAAWAEIKADSLYYGNGREISEGYIQDQYKAALQKRGLTQTQIDAAVVSRQTDIKALAAPYLKKSNEKRAEKIASALQAIRERLLRGEEFDIETNFKTSYYLQGLNSDEINKAITDNRQELDKLIAEQKQLKSQRSSGKLQEAWQHLIEAVNRSGYSGKEMVQLAMKQYLSALEPYFTQEQINDELKQRLENIRYTNIKFFESKVKLYKDIYSGTSYAWLMISPSIISDNSSIGRADNEIYENKFQFTAVSGKDGNNELVLLSSNGENLLPQGNDHVNLFKSEIFGVIVTLGQGITSEDVLKKSESAYGKFQKTTIKKEIILEPFAYKIASEHETWGFQDDNIKIEIQQLVYHGEQPEEISMSSPDYQKLLAQRRVNGTQPDPGEIERIIKKLVSHVKMSVYDMKRVKKLNALYQEELNALNAKRQASEKLAQDKADQAKKDALNF